MRYLLAIVLPPVGMLSVGKPLQAIFCLVLMVTLIGWPIAAIWSVLVVHGAFAEGRQKRLLEEMRAQTEAQVAAAKAAQAAAEAAQAQAAAQIQVSQAQMAQAAAAAQAAGLVAPQPEAAQPPPAATA